MTQRLHHNYLEEERCVFRRPLQLQSSYCGCVEFNSMLIICHFTSGRHAALIHATHKCLVLLQTKQNHNQLLAYVAVGVKHKLHVKTSRPFQQLCIGLVFYISLKDNTTHSCLQYLKKTCVLRTLPVSKTPKQWSNNQVEMRKSIHSQYRVSCSHVKLFLTQPAYTMFSFPQNRRSF